MGKIYDELEIEWKENNLSWRIRAQEINRKSERE